MVALQLENQRCEFPPEEVDRITGRAATDSHNAFQLQREHEGGPRTSLVPPGNCVARLRKIDTPPYPGEALRPHVV